MGKSYLCLCVFLVVAGEALAFGFRRQYCERGARVIGEFYENPCRYHGGRGRVRTLQEELREGQLTVPRLQAYLTTVCSEVLPDMRQCFAESISVCGESRQQYLNSLARNTSVLCEVNSTLPSSWISLAVSRLTDEQVADESWCSGRSDAAHEGPCRQEAGRLSRMADKSESFFGTASIEELLPFIQRYYSGYLQCRIQHLRDDPQRCPGWRAYILTSLLSDMVTPPLGLRLNFTDTQVEEMFELREAVGGAPVNDDGHAHC